MALAREQGVAIYEAQGSLWRGWALAAQGQGEEGVAQMHQGLTAMLATGQDVALPRWLALLAEAYEQGRQVAKGLHVLAEALAVVDKTGVRRWEAELYRLKGELLLRSGVQGPKPGVLTADARPQTLEA